MEAVELLKFKVEYVIPLHEINPAPLYFSSALVQTTFFSQFTV